MKEMLSTWADELLQWIRSNIVIAAVSLPNFVHYLSERNYIDSAHTPLPANRGGSVECNHCSNLGNKQLIRDELIML